MWQRYWTNINFLYYFLFVIFLFHRWPYDMIIKHRWIDFKVDKLLFHNRNWKLFRFKLQGSHNHPIRVEALKFCGSFNCASSRSVADRQIFTFLSFMIYSRSHFSTQDISPVIIRNAQKYSTCDDGLDLPDSQQLFSLWFFLASLPLIDHAFFSIGGRQWKHIHFSNVRSRKNYNKASARAPLFKDFPDFLDQQLLALLVFDRVHK